MTECFCEKCSSTPAPTFTGRFLTACHARYVLRKKRDARRAYLIDVANKAGEQAALELLTAMMFQEGEDVIDIAPGSKMARQRSLI